MNLAQLTNGSKIRFSPALQVSLGQKALVPAAQDSTCSDVQRRRQVAPAVDATSQATAAVPLRPGAVLTILKSVHAGCHAKAVDFQPPVRPSTAWGARRLEAPLRLLPAIAVAIVVALVKPL